MNSAESYTSILGCSVFCHGQTPLFHVVFTLSTGCVLNWSKDFCIIKFKESNTYKIFLSRDYFVGVALLFLYT